MISEDSREVALRNEFGRGDVHECLHQEPLPAVHIVLVVRDLRTGRIETGINIEIRGSRTEIRRSLTFNRRSSRLFASIRLLIVATKLVVARALTCYTFVAEIATKKIEGRRLTARLFINHDVKWCAICAAQATAACNGIVHIAFDAVECGTACRGRVLAWRCCSNVFSTWRRREGG